MKVRQEEGKSIVLVTNAPFPIGNVSTLRYTSYLTALSEKGIKSKVVVFFPSSDGREGVPPKGEYKGIYYEYASSPTWRTNSILLKIFIAIGGILRSWLILSKHSYSTLILYGENSFFINVFYYIYCKLHGIRYLGDRSEYPSEKTRNSRVMSWFYTRKIRLFDGMIIMTNELSSYYSKLANRNDFIYTLPMTIDDSRFSGIVQLERKKPIIVVVFGSHNRDGLLDSIKTFMKYCEQYSGLLNLVLIGPFETLPNHLEIKDIINRSHFVDRIEIKGLLPIDQVPQYLSDATCLLTTPTFYKSGGFPTKLGEYMLSKTPIVLTNAGEISQYLEADKDAVICEPGDYDALAMGIRKIEEDPEFAKYLVSNAYKKVLTTFNAKTYVDGLMYFCFN